MSTLQEGVQSEVLVSTGGVLYDDVVIPAAGQTIEFVMPIDFHTCLVKVSVCGVNDGDLSGWAEQLYNVELLEIFTTEGESLRVEGGNGLDPYLYSHYVQKTRDRSYRTGGSGDGELMNIVYDLPLSFGSWKWFNHAGEFAAMPLEIADRLRIVFGSDADTGQDARYATVQAFGLRKPKPKMWRTTIPDAYTAVALQSHWSELPPDTRLAGVWTFHTTNFNNCKVANRFLSVREQRLAYGRTSFFKRVKTIQLQEVFNASVQSQPNLYGMEPPASHTYWPLDACEEGSGEPNPGNLVIESVGGVAEATRVYPVVWRLV